MSSRSQVTAWIVFGFVCLAFGLVYAYLLKPEYDRYMGMQERLEAVELLSARVSQQNVALSAQVAALTVKVEMGAAAEERVAALEAFVTALKEGLPGVIQELMSRDEQLRQWFNELKQEVDRIKLILSAPNIDNTGLIEARLGKVEAAVAALQAKAHVHSKVVKKAKITMKRCNKPVVRCDQGYPMRCEAV